MTFPEIIFWNFVKGKKLGYKFRRQHSIGHFIVDFYCPELALVVEIDGMSHDDIAQIKKDKMRQNILEEKGNIVVRYTNKRIINNMESVYEDLMRVCKKIKSNQKLQMFYHNKTLFIIIIFSFVIGFFCQAVVPNDPFYGYQSYLKQFESVWDKTTGSNSVIVAVIDSGTDLFHEDLRANVWINQDEVANDGIDNDRNGYIDDVRGWDFYDSDNDPSPSYTPDCGANTVCSPEGINHGTLVAGIIGAVGNNGLGVAGVNWQVKIMPIRILQQSGMSDSRNIISAINYAVSNGAQIINMSFVGQDDYPEFRTTLQNAYNHGVLIVAASGNGEFGGDDLAQSPEYPICYQSSTNEDLILGVGSSDKNGNLSEFSNFGSSCVDVLASGEDFYGLVHYDPNITNLNTAYDGYFTGTSMSAPLVSGLAALIKAYNPAYSNKQISELIYSTASYSPALSGKVKYGVIDPAKIFSTLEKPGTLVKASTPKVYYLAADGKRYVFPDQNTYYTWYANFSGVSTISDAQLANLVIGGNVTFRPGVKLIKIVSDPKVYAVSKGGTLRWITTEALANSLYGADWARQVADVDVSLFMTYNMGTDILTPADYSAANEMVGTLTINDDLGY